MSAVRWPAGHEPAGADVHEVNATTSTASAEAVWAWLVRPERWGGYYANARRVRHVEGPWPVLGLGSRFTWLTVGARVDTVVTEWEEGRRLAWTGSGLGARGHHAWVLEPTPTGCRILTEETQRGVASRVLGPVLRPAMRTFHQRWVEGLARTAERGAP